MVFGLILIVLVLLVAFMHMVQGFFTATLSAIFAVFAAVIAVGFHENVVALMKPGKLADSANGMLLCILFAVAYVVMRVIFDAAVPGNVRFQSTLDKIGAIAMGLVAGTCAAGILAIAAQTMPFGASIFGYSRYELGPDREMGFQTDRQKTALNRFVTDEMKGDGDDFKSVKFKDEHVKTLLLPVDDIVLKLASAMSSGSLSGERPLSAVHADYLQEAFASRIGIEPSAKRTASNLDKSAQINVDKIAMVDRLKAVQDSELPEIRGKKDKDAKPDASVKDEVKPAKEDLRPVGKQAILIIRITIDKSAGDEKDAIFRFTPASIRLVTHDPQTGAAKNNYPIGTMDAWGGGTFWPNRIDDPLFAKVADASGVDLVFMVEDRDEALDGAVEAPKKGKADAKPAATTTIKPGVFLEVKRLARVDLGGTSVENGMLPPDPKIEVMRKIRMKAPPPPGS